MIRRLWQLPLTIIIVLGVAMFSVMAGNTYTNNFEDITVSEGNHYEFDIFVGQESGDTASLTLQVYDVDEEAGELDKVYINNIYLGYLSGTNGKWSTSSFNITDEIDYNEDNTVRVEIDPEGGEPDTWQATIAWGQILVDGGSADSADITSVNASGTWDSIQVQTSISSYTNEELRLELNLLDSTSNNKDIFSEVFSLANGSSTTLDRTMALPSEPTGTETFTIEANLFNHLTGVQQTIKTTTWTYSASQPPTNIFLSNESIDENLPALSLVGILTATDADSISHDFTLIGGDIGSFTITGDQLLAALSFDHETRESYSLHIEAKDGEDNTYSEWFAITVNNVNETPTALADDASVAEGTTILVDVLSNDADPDLDPLTVVSVSVPSKGSAVRQPDNTVRYTPSEGSCGVDSFSYTIEDGNGESASAWVTITILNGAPTPVDDVATTPEEEAVLISVLDNDSDPGGHVPTLQSVAAPLHGTAVMVGDTIQYKPVPRFEGSDRFSYTVRDACGATATGWVEVDVQHTNHPPTAHAGGLYQGIVGEPLVLDATFSNDPDISDFLQYRWDLNGSGIPNTGWLTSPRYTAIYEAPFFGEIVLEVRDLYRGLPTGESAQASALVRIEQRAPEVRGVVFVDLDVDGLPDPDEPTLPQVPLVLDGETTAMTDNQGRATFANLDPGEHTVAITADGLALLRLQGFGIDVPSLTLDVQPGDPTIALFPYRRVVGTLSGLVYVDTDGSGEQEQGESGVPGLLVFLDGKAKRETNDEGRFLFMNVLAGDYVLVIESEQHRWEEPVRIDADEQIELIVVWPSPESGFLEVKVKLGSQDEERGE